MKLYMNGLGDEKDVFVAEVRNSDDAQLDIDRLEAGYMRWIHNCKPAEAEFEQSSVQVMFNRLMENFDGVDFTLASPFGNQKWIYDPDEEVWTLLPEGYDISCECGGLQH